MFSVSSSGRRSFHQGFLATVDAGLLSGVAARAKAPEYSRLLGDCRGLYCETRLGLVAPVTRSRIAALAGQPLPTLTRRGCAYLMQVGRDMCHALLPVQRLS